MVLLYRKDLKKIARVLRSAMTDAEIILWRHLRKDRLGLRFYRQRPIGPFVVDFYCPTRRLVIEIDGGQHYEEGNTSLDITRTKYLNGQDFKVIRFTNIEVFKNINGVLEKIKESLALE